MPLLTSYASSECTMAIDKREQVLATSLTKTNCPVAVQMRRYLMMVAKTNSGFRRT